MTHQPRLTEAKNIEAKNLVFSKFETATIPGSTPPLTYKRIRLGIKGQDGTVTDLILPTEDDLFSFGVQENTDMATGKVNGFTMPICLWNKQGVTPAEKLWTDKFDEIVDACKEYLLDNKDSLELYDLDSSELKKFNPLYWKREKGRIIDGQGPTLYSKLIVTKKDLIVSLFTNKDTDEEIDPLSLQKKYCFVKAAIKIESIFIGANRVSLQVKLYEAMTRPLDSGVKRLLRPNPIPQVIASSSAKAILQTEDEDEDDDEDDDDDDDDDDEEEGSIEEKPAPPPLTKVLSKKPPAKPSTRKIFK